MQVTKSIRIEVRAKASVVGTAAGALPETITDYAATGRRYPQAVPLAAPERVQGTGRVSRIARDVQKATISGMKPWLVLILTLVGLTHIARASGATMIDVSTTDEGVSYTMHDYNSRTELTFKKAEELEGWMRKHYPEGNKERGAGVWLRPDDRTSFKTVFDLMLRFKGTNLEMMLIEGKVGNDRIVASWPLAQFKVNKMDDEKLKK